MECLRDDTEEARGVGHGTTPALRQDDKIVVGLGAGQGEKGEHAARAHATVEVCEGTTMGKDLCPQGQVLVGSGEQVVDATGLSQGTGQFIRKETSAQPVVQERVGRERG